MKKLTLFAAAAALSVAAFGQKKLDLSKTANGLEYSEPDQSGTYAHIETTIWSEDFSNGIPSDWINSGSTASASWEYRGPATSPSNSTGSRGAYNGTRGPITSSSASNGFVIFDSDYLDNGGIQGAFGSGSAPSPHIGKLRSHSFDLTNYNFVDLTFTQYYRRFGGPNGSQASTASYVDVSTDGGQTFPYTFIINDDIAVNAQTATNNVKTIPIGTVCGGQDSVVVQFRFDGEYYFWMLDDVKVEEAAASSAVSFVKVSSSNGNAPMVDFASYNTVKTGSMSLKQNRGLAFDANVWSTGSVTQTNVLLKVDILNSNGTSVTTLYSDTIPTLGYGDTLDYFSLNTYNNYYTPTAKGLFDVEISVVSDQGQYLYSGNDLNFRVSDDVTSRDFGTVDNFIGTTQLGDYPAFASVIDLVDNERAFSVRIGLDPSSIVGTYINAFIVDSTYQLNANGSVTGTIVGQNPAGGFTISTSNVAQGFVDVPLVNTQGDVPFLVAGRYCLVLMVQVSSTGDNFAIANNQTFENGGGCYMYSFNDQSWYSGYSGSRFFENPMIQLIGCTDQNAAACMSASYISEEENSMNQIQITPNPASEFINLDFGMAVGEHNVSIVDLTGKVMKSEVVRADANVSIFIGDLNAGMYMVRVQKGNDVKTMKLSVL